jgi:ABC-type lipoprotein export system ATPase subunit
MTRLELLKGLSFGARVAEDETILTKYFVETDQWDRIFRGDIDIMRGDKGSGKSAIYSLLATKAQNLLDKGILSYGGKAARMSRSLRAQWRRATGACR